MWSFLKTPHTKVLEFRQGRERQPDEVFVAECGLPDDPESHRIAIGVRRAVGGVGLVDPLFIHATDRFPEDLSKLPLWDSMDWVTLVLQLEDELGKPMPNSIQEWKLQNQFTVKQLIDSVRRSVTTAG